MATYTDPGLAIKQLAANVKAKKADATALASKLDKPAAGTGLKVWDAATGAWVAALTPGLPSLLSDVRISPMPAGEPKPLAAIGGQIWGYGTGYIRTTLDGGQTWQQVCPLPSGASAAIRMGRNTSGEIILVCAEGVWLSSGWATGAPTWAKKVSTTGLAYAQTFSFDGWGDKWIYTEYGPGAGQAWVDSRYAYISTDGGVTWTRCWDSDVNAPGSAGALSHVHGVCYDRWADRFYISEGHGPDAGIYHSVDNGKTWGLAPGMKVANLPGVTASPTLVAATNEGLVCGSDSGEAQGLFGVVRTEDPMSQVQVQTWSWRTGKSGNNGWGNAYQRDEQTGLVYIQFRSQSTGVAPIIAAGTPTSGGKVYEWPGADAFGPQDTYLSWAFDSQRRAVIYGVKAGVGYLTTGYLPLPTSKSVMDSGNLLQGASNDSTSIAVGYQAATGVALRAAAVGVRAAATQDSVAVGSTAATTGTDAVAVGSASSSTSLGVAVGSGSVAAAMAVAVGGKATAAGSQSVSVGRTASAGAVAATAVGYGAKADVGTQSVAIGSASTTTGSYQVAVGDRLLEIGKFPAALTPAVAGKARLAIVEVDGKMTLQVSFPSGAAQTIAREMNFRGVRPTPAYAIDARRALTGLAAGDMVLDTSLSKPCWWTGSAWVDATGTAV